jgi:hypothetical protein
MTHIDWPVVHAITRHTRPEQHSPRCPSNTHRMGVEHCTCWVLNEARAIADRVTLVYARRNR